MEKPKQLNITAEEIEELVERLNNDQLSSQDKELIRGVFEFSIWLNKVLNKTRVTIGQLRRMLGFSTKKVSHKKKDTINNETADPNQNGQNSLNVDENLNGDLTTNLNINVKQKNNRPTHNGKNGQDDYKTAERNLIFLDNQYRSGMLCPYCNQGKMYKAKAGIMLHLDGSPMVKPIIYELETLRCNLCGATIKAKLPPETKEGKHGYGLIAQVALQKFLVGVPYHAQAEYHRLLETPLPASTQWMLVKILHRVVIYVFNRLIYFAAQSWLCTLDDTKCRILSVIKENKNKNKNERTGTYTTGLLFEHDGHQIALYISGRQYAGENLKDTLKNRETDLEPMHVMADGSPNNNPKKLNLAVIMHNCLTHARRQFYDLSDYYEEESLRIIDFISQVYDNDRVAKQNNLPIQERLAYHQQHSTSIMQNLKKYLETLLLDKKKCELNGELTASINYILSRWQEITRFLTVPGAPLDSNAVERLLKTIIRIRKTAMFFKTEASAAISSTVMSVIKTCVENKENPLKYLIALQQHENKVMECPDSWMPWNYKETLLTINNTS